jgi:hypothetical protein
MQYGARWSRDRKVSVSTLIVSQALIQHQDGVSLHPDLFLWDKQLSSYRRRWFDCTAKNPLAWYAALCESSPAALLASRCRDLPEDMSQYWVASPYHAQLARTVVRVMPEGQFSWTVEDADYLCATLNPLLAEEGMQLSAVGVALLLACREPMDAYPQGFGEISGQLLPDRDHAGEDGGRLNRLLSEIQMLLFQHPSEQRHAQGEPDVSGLWLWSPLDGRIESHAKQIAVSTRNPVLQSIVNGKDAGVIITEAERMGELVQSDAALPKRIVLEGDAYAVLLTKPWLPNFGKAVWKPKSPKAESALLSMLI